MAGRLYRRITCENGVTLSIQAHEGSYCIPRMNNCEEYSHCEVGYLTWPDDVGCRKSGYKTPWGEHRDSKKSWMIELNEYNEDMAYGPQADPRVSVLGYVPIEVIGRFIAANGGVKRGEMPPFDPECCPRLASSMTLIHDEDGAFYSKGRDPRLANTLRA